MVTVRWRDDDDDINNDVYRSKKARSLADRLSMHGLPKGCNIVCAGTTALILFCAIVLFASIRATHGAHGRIKSRNMFARDKKLQQNDWDKTLMGMSTRRGWKRTAAKDLDDQVRSVQNMEDELKALNVGGGTSGGGRGGGLRKKEFLDPMEPMQQYMKYQHDKSKTQGRRKSKGISAAMQSYIDDVVGSV
ncbi:hypothetical protein GUITHDRAFT_132298 [Guillardia theta CCMP2712]|uniref:Uncharacterized protein n=2 Tax=Guillardia theta TaxID=55529 RepID=L1K1Z8_GUITC|nr:hypothetical protein GUITHDRAFT_132298 [Guillardia theta CCMP2712]EKX54604.1 hypothetical protein GUITHDRAFT_132298 [Guillardia theta CCMP2712]|eukprot:XP_005841584.1 hypothetical protein GUITHDRAFT_132298 [Guillardia theta CCMP2712]